MKKSIGVFIAAILVVCLFAGCAETASTENAGAAETPAVPAAAESAGTAAESAGTEPAAAENEYAWDPNIGANPEKNEYYFVFVPKLVHPFYEPLIEGMERAAAEYAEQGITVHGTGMPQLRRTPFCRRRKWKRLRRKARMCLELRYRIRL